MSHISSAFYPSGFKNAVGLSIDGFGDFCSICITKCESENIKVIKKYLFPHSLGVFYESFTQLIGFKNYGDEYKLMGLAPYGKPNYFDKIKNNLFINKNFFKLNEMYFNHHKKNYSYKFEGVPKQNPIYSEKIFNLFSKEEIQNEKENLAASTQKVYEHFFMKIIKHAISLYNSDKSLGFLL